MHTPTPWVSIQKWNPDECYIVAAQGSMQPIATVHAHRDGDIHTNAALIVKAVNSYATMKGALVALLHEPMSERAVDKAKRALTLAEGKE